MKRTATCFLVILTMGLSMNSQAEFNGASFGVQYGGEDWLVSVSKEQIAKSPQWTVAESNPPVAARRALELADAALPQLSDGDTTRPWFLYAIELHPTIELDPTGEESWYYCVFYMRRPRINLDDGTRAYDNWRVIVTMAGEVISPVKNKPVKKEDATTVGK